MTDRAIIGAGVIGDVLAVICSAPLLAVGLPFAGFGAWLTGAGLGVLPLVVAGFGLIAWIIHRLRTKATCGGTTMQKKSGRP